MWGSEWAQIPHVGVASRTQRSSSTHYSAFQRRNFDSLYSQNSCFFCLKENKKDHWKIIISELRFQHVGVTRNTKLDLTLKLLYPDDENPGKPVTSSRKVLCQSPMVLLDLCTFNMNEASRIKRTKAADLHSMASDPWNPACCGERSLVYADIDFQARLCFNKEERRLECVPHSGG